VVDDHERRARRFDGWAAGASGVEQVECANL
jgi:hypothetical protein